MSRARSLVAQLHACRDPNELRALAGLDPMQPAMRTFYRAGFGLALDADERTLLARVTAQRAPTSAAKVLAICAGRASRKTTSGGDWTAWHALCAGHDAHAAPGSRIVHGKIAPSRKQASEAARMQCAALDALAPLGVRFDVRDARGESVEIIVTSPRTACEHVISVFSLDADIARGFAWASVHFIEAGHMPAEGVFTLARMQQAILPRLAQFPRSQVLYDSTPGAPEGPFYDLVTKPPPGSLVVAGSTFHFNPTISEDEARAWVPDPEQYAQEILATRWGASGEAFLSDAAVMACIEGGETLRDRIASLASRVLPTRKEATRA